MISLLSYWRSSTIFCFSANNIISLECVSISPLRSPRVRATLKLMSFWFFISLSIESTIFSVLISTLLMSLPCELRTRLPTLPTMLNNKAQAAKIVPKRSAYCGLRLSANLVLRSRNPASTEISKRPTNPVTLSID